MIFATVGTQLPFDRLLSALDDWAAERPDFPVLAQTGTSGRAYPHLDCRPTLDQGMFTDLIGRARLVVSHAGMGTILQAAEAGKPVIVLPRRAAFGEHRNDHQLATAAEMATLPTVTVIDQAEDLATAIDAALKAQAAGPALGASASPQLIEALRGFIQADARRPATAPRHRPLWSRA